MNLAKSFPTLYSLAILGCFQVLENNTEKSRKGFALFKCIEKTTFKHLKLVSDGLSTFSSMDSSSEAISFLKNGQEMKETKLFK